MSSEAPLPGFEVYFRSWRIFYSTRLVGLTVIVLALVGRRFATAALLAGTVGAMLALVRFDMWLWERQNPGHLDSGYQRANVVLRAAAFTRRPRPHRRPGSS